MSSLRRRCSRAAGRRTQGRWSTAARSSTAGAAAATAQNTTDLARFGLRQRVLGKSGDVAAQAQGGLRGRILRGELTVRGDLRYRCGAMVELHRKEFGLDGAYPLTAVKHRWERGLFTTELTWEGEA